MMQLIILFSLVFIQSVIKVTYAFSELFIYYKAYFCHKYSTALNELALLP